MTDSARHIQNKLSRNYLQGRIQPARTNYSQLKSFLVSLDLFPQPISLTYKDEFQYRTIFGGSISLAVLLLLLSFTGFQLSSLINQREMYVNSQSHFYQLDDPDFQLSLKDQSDLAFAFGFMNNMLPSAIGRIDVTHTRVFHDQSGDFADYPVDQANRTIVERNLTYDTCDQETFPTVDFDAYGYENMFCINQAELGQFEDDLTIRGKYYSSSFEYLSFQVHMCMYQDFCSEREIVENYFSQHQFTFPMIVQAVNIQNVAQTVSQYVIDDFSWNFDVSKQIGVDFYLQKNLISAYDSIWTRNGKDYSNSDQNVVNSTAISFERARETYLLRDSTATKVLDIKVRLSNEQIIYERQAQTVFTCASAIGGFFSFLIILGQVLTNYFSKFSFMGSLIKSQLYYKVYYDQDIHLGSQMNRTQKILNKMKSDSKPAATFIKLNRVSSFPDGETGNKNDQLGLVNSSPDRQIETKNQNSSSKKKSRDKTKVSKVMSSDKKSQKSQLNMMKAQSDSLEMQPLSTKDQVNNIQVNTLAQPLKKAQTDSFLDQEDQESVIKRLHTRTEGIKENASLNHSQVLDILNSIVNKQRFSISAKQSLNYFLCGHFLKSQHKLKQSKELKPFYLFKKGQQKIKHSLDVNNLLFLVETQKVIRKLLFTPFQQTLLRYQNGFLMESSSDGAQEPDLADDLNFPTRMDSLSPWVKLAALADLRNMVISHSSVNESLNLGQRKKLSQLDVQLINSMHRDKGAKINSEVDNENQMSQKFQQCFEYHKYFWNENQKGQNMPVQGQLNEISSQQAKLRLYKGVIQKDHDKIKDQQKSIAKMQTQFKKDIKNLNEEFKQYESKINETQAVSQSIPQLNLPDQNSNLYLQYPKLRESNLQQLSVQTNAFQESIMGQKKQTDDPFYNAYPQKMYQDEDIQVDLIDPYMIKSVDAQEKQTTQTQKQVQSDDQNTSLRDSQQSHLMSFKQQLGSNEQVEVYQNQTAEKYKQEEEKQKISVEVDLVDDDQSDNQVFEMQEQPLDDFCDSINPQIVTASKNIRVPEKTQSKQDSGVGSAQNTVQNINFTPQQQLASHLSVNQGRNSNEKLEGEFVRLSFDMIKETVEKLSQNSHKSREDDHQGLDDLTFDMVKKEINADAKNSESHFKSGKSQILSVRKVDKQPLQGQGNLQVESLDNL